MKSEKQKGLADDNVQYIVFLYNTKKICYTGNKQVKVCEFYFSSKLNIQC